MEITIECSECREELSAELTLDSRNQPLISVSICEKCKKAAEEAAKEEGYDEGFANASPEEK